MGNEAAAIRKTLKEKLEPAVAKAKGESQKLRSLRNDIDKGVDKSIADRDVERMELYEAAYGSCQKRVGVLLTAVEVLLKELDKLAEAPAFVEELARFTALTKTLGEIKADQLNGLSVARRMIADMHKARESTRYVAGEVEQRWAVAEAQVAAASKEAAAALVTMKALWQKAGKAADPAPNFDAKTLALTKAQAKAFKIPFGLAAGAKLKELAASTLLFLNKNVIDKDELAVFLQDGKALTAKATAATADAVETLRLQAEIDKMVIQKSLFFFHLAKATNLPQQDLARLSQVWSDTPGKLLAELDATIKRLKLKLVAKDVYEVLRRKGLV